MTEYPGSYYPAPPPMPYSPPPRRRTSRLAAIALVGGLVGGTGGVAIDHLVTGGGSSTTSASSTASSTRPVSDPTGSAASISAVAAVVSPSVVEVKETISAGEGIGSGVILTGDGEILTNNHVVADAANGGGTVTVTFGNGKTAAATIVGRDANSDLAVIKARNVSGLTPATLGDSSSVKIGDQVVAIGSPEGLEGTVTSGIVSYLNRKVTVASSDSGGSGNDPFGDQMSNSAGQTVTYNAIQTDASINPGNSGGPLINASGQIIGINSAIYSPTASDSSSSAGSVGLGFAIPINQAKSIIAELERGGSQ